MGRGKLTEEERIIISRSPWVLAVNEERITWSEEFKKHFIHEYKEGKNPTRIFEEAGFSLELLGSKRIERASANWREMYKVPTRKRKNIKE